MTPTEFCAKHCPNTTVVTEYPDEATWIEARKKYVTASEVAALFQAELATEDEKPYDTPFSLWLSKTGRSEKAWHDREKRRNRMALAQENVIAEFFREEHPDVEVIKPKSYTLITNTQYPFMSATADFMTLESGMPGVLETKRLNLFSIGDWNSSETLPLKFLIQIFVQMGLLGFKHGYLAAAFDGGDFRSHGIELNPEYFAEINRRAEKFVRDHVQTDTPPEVTGLESDTKAIRLLHPKDSGERVMLPREGDDMYDAVLKWTEVEKAATLEKDAAKNQLKVWMGDATIGQLPSGRTVSWKTQGGRPSYLKVPLDSRETLEKAGVAFDEMNTPESRVLRLHKPKA